MTHISLINMSRIVDNCTRQDITTIFILFNEYSYYDARSHSKQEPMLMFAVVCYNKYIYIMKTKKCRNTWEIRVHVLLAKLL